MTSGELNKRTIIVTGANRGIGAEIALELARRGFHVACFARNGQAPATDDRELATRLTGIVCDVTDVEQAAEAITHAPSLAEQARWGECGSARKCPHGLAFGPFWRIPYPAC